MTEPEFEASRQRQKGGGGPGVTILNALICRKSEILDIFLSSIAVNSAAAPGMPELRIDVGGRRQGQGGLKLSVSSPPIITGTPNRLHSKCVALGRLAPADGSMRARSGLPETSAVFRSLGDSPCAAGIACWTNGTISAQ